MDLRVQNCRSASGGHLRSLVVVPLLLVMLALAQDFGLVPVFETARMYTGPIPPLRLERIFGVTTFELG